MKWYLDSQSAICTSLSTDLPNGVGSNKPKGVNGPLWQVRHGSWAAFVTASFLPRQVYTATLLHAPPGQQTRILVGNAHALLMKRLPVSSGCLWAEKQVLAAPSLPIRATNMMNSAFNWPCSSEPLFLRTLISQNPYFRNPYFQKPYFSLRTLIFRTLISRSRTLIYLFWYAILGTLFLVRYFWYTIFGALFLVRSFWCALFGTLFWYAIYART